MKKIILVCVILVGHYFSYAQSYIQYFDGADTVVAWGALLVHIDADSSNVWQVGPPAKTIFNSANTAPNVIVTDTINYYPSNDTSTFSIKAEHQQFWGIFALHWIQKLDMDVHHDGGIVEYSIDTGNTWHNAFNDPNVYNFFGYDPQNKDTLQSGEFAFSGTDTTWKNIWLCFDYSWLSTFTDTIQVRFVLKSDSINNNKEGWMIDNFYLQTTQSHPVKETVKKEYITVYPNPAKDVVNIELQRINDFHIIEHMELWNDAGKKIKSWDNIPTRYWFDTSKYSSGHYVLKIKTNLKSENIPFIINRK